MPRGRLNNSSGRALGAKASKAEKATGNGANLGFEGQLFLAADKLRKNLEPSDYKHVSLGLIFLKYTSIAIEARHAALLAEDTASAEDRDDTFLKTCSGYPRRRAGRISNAGLPIRHIEQGKKVCTYRT